MTKCGGSSIKDWLLTPEARAAGAYSVLRGSASFAQVMGDANWQAVLNASAPVAKHLLLSHHGMEGVGELLDRAVRPMRSALEARGCELRLATLLREPMARTGSGYRYLYGFNRKRTARLRVPVASRETLTYFVDATANAQSRYLIGSLDGSETWGGDNFTHWVARGKPLRFDAGAHARIHAVARALLASEFEAVGRLERMPAFLAYVAASLGIPVPSTAPHSRPSKSFRSADAGLLDVLLAAAAPLIADRNRFDTALYRELFCDRDGSETLRLARGSPST